MLFMASAFMCISQLVEAQLVKQKNVQTKTQSRLDWYNSSPEDDGVFGAEVDKAYQFLKGKKAKTRPVIAVIGSGMDVEHEALKSNVWTNPKEKLNEKDDDKNGYADDIHGWNFIGGKDGQVMEVTLKEGDREFYRLKDKFGGIIHYGDVFYTYVDGKRVDVPEPEDLAGYLYYRKCVAPESPLAIKYEGIMTSYAIQEYARKFDKEMRARFPEKTKFTGKDLATCWDPNGPQDTMANIAMVMLAYAIGFSGTDDWEVAYKQYRDNTRVEQAKNEYVNLLRQAGDDRRKEIVGDDFRNINDRKYGNNVLLTSNAGNGTMMAGIIAGKRGVEGRNNPIVENAEVMPLVVSASAGEPYLKDIALAIRYAVDQHADIILLPQQNTLYPEDQRKWVSEAIRYAEQKGVLIIVPAWEMAIDLKQTVFYPNRWMDGEKEITNLMVVSASGKDGNPAMNSNYGAQELDIYAPGIDILSTYTGDTYESGTSVLLAASTLAGVAALVKSYYPELTGTQIRNILLESVTSRKGVEVEKGIRVDNKVAQDLFLFEQLCLSGGIVNAYNALVAADKMTK